jgi:hypothetical protein
MMELTKRGSPQEDVVGWFSTRPNVPETSFYIHDFYVRLSHPNIIHLTVDCTAETDRMPIKAYVCSPLGVPQAPTDLKDSNPRFDQPALFAQVPVEIFCWDAERVGCMNGFCLDVYGRFGLLTSYFFSGSHYGWSSRSESSGEHPHRCGSSSSDS